MDGYNEHAHAMDGCVSCFAIYLIHIYYSIYIFAIVVQTFWDIQILFCHNALMLDFQRIPPWIWRFELVSFCSVFRNMSIYDAFWCWNSEDVFLLGFTIVYTFFLSSNLFIPYVATLFNFIKGGHCCLIHFFFAFFVAWHGSAKLKLLTQLRRQREQPGLLLEWRRPVLEAVQKVMQQRIVMKQKSI